RARILGDDVDRPVAAERSERVAQRLVSAGSDFPIAFQRRREVDARPRRRRACNFVEACARIAEQFLLRHRWIWLRWIRRRQRRRVWRTRLLALLRRICRIFVSLVSGTPPCSEEGFPALGAPLSSSGA